MPSEIEFPLSTLILAYRQLKHDLYWENTIPRKRQLLDYEQGLLKQLQQLRKLLSEGGSKLKTRSFLGEAYHIPKGFNQRAWEDSNEKNTSFVFSDPWQEFEHQEKIRKEKSAKGKDKEPHSFRSVAIPSMDFQMLGTLWCREVGAVLDANLSPNCRGNRLRRTAWDDDESPVKRHSAGLFRPYFQAYDRWRSDGLKAIRDQLKSGQEVVALTMDLRSYYNHISPSFLRTSEITDQLENARLRELNDLFATALEGWAKKHGKDELGIPIGLTASRLLANSCLAEFDKELVEQLNPLYYGRYVDDVFLVLRPSPSLKSSDSINDWLQASAPTLWEQRDDDLVIKHSCIGESALAFAPDKQMCFRLEPESGMDVVEALDRSISDVSSEFQLMPEPDQEGSAAKHVLVLEHGASEMPDALRKTDGVSVRRLGLGIHLRNQEQFERLLASPSEWSKSRKEFYRLLNRQVVTPQTVGDYWKYFPRIIGLMVANSDFEEAATFGERVGLALTKFCSGAKELGSCRTILGRHFEEELYASLPASVKAQDKSVGKLLMRWQEALDCHFDQGIRLSSIVEQLRLRDLARTPLSSAIRHGSDPKWLRYDSFSRIEFSSSRLEFQSIYREVADEVGELPPHEKPLNLWGLFFSTRPLLPGDIDLLLPESIYDSAIARQWMTFVRGHSSRNRPDPSAASDGDAKDRPIHLPSSRLRNPIKVGLTSFETPLSSYYARLNGVANLSTGRLRQLARLVSDAIKVRPRPAYLVLPEVSLPREWMMETAAILGRAGISLIVGCEYEFTNNSQIHNPSYACLLSDGLGYPTLRIVSQDKLQPAPHEADEIRVQRHPAVTFVNRQGYDPSNPPLRVIQHGSFVFGMILCSDFTDIAHRSTFRGHVDALFVLAWNQDLNTFSPLVESAASDVHCFVIQCNNRSFGDSRIRQPASKNHERDIIQVRGGENDQVIVGSLDIRELRSFHATNESPPQPFKPKPTHFQMSALRRALHLKEIQIQPND